MTPAELAKWMEVSDDDVKPRLTTSAQPLPRAGAAPRRADRVPDHGAKREAAAERHQGRHELRRACRRTRPQGTGHRSRHGGQGRHHRSGRGRRRLRTERRRGQRAGPGPVRRGASPPCSRSSRERPSRLPTPTRRSARSIALERAKTEVQETPRQDRGRARRRRVAAEAAEKLKLPVVDLRRRPLRPRSRTASRSPTFRTPATSSTPRSRPKSASTTIRSRSTAAISGTTSLASRRRVIARLTK